MKTLLILLFFLPVVTFAQEKTYQQLAEKAVDCIEKDSLRQAETLLRQALALEPKNQKNVMLFSNLGLVQRRLGDYEKAIESYSYALNFAPLSIPILLDRAALYMEVGKTDIAYYDYCKVLDENKENKEALLMRASIYMFRHDYNAARIDYKRLLELDPSNYQARLGLVSLEQSQKRFKEALDLLGKMLTERPQDVTLYMARANIEMDMEHYDLALVDLDEAIRLDPKSPTAHVLRGNVYLKEKKKALAKIEFEKAIALGVPHSEMRELLQQCK